MRGHKRNGDDCQDKQRRGKALSGAYTRGRLPIPKLYSKLRGRFGFLDWWPGDTKDEIIIGAILTQNASWKNVERAISNLKRADCITLKSISSASKADLEGHVRPSGFYRQKAKRLKIFANHVFSNHGSLNSMFKMDPNELRKELLSIKGIGMETADSIILYAADKPIFVIDAYTRRIMNRVYGTDKEMDYEQLQGHISSSIKEDLNTYKDFHAQFVELGKSYCRTKPLCNECPVKRYCQYNVRQSR